MTTLRTSTVEKSEKKTLMGLDSAEGLPSTEIHLPVSRAGKGASVST